MIKVFFKNRDMNRLYVHWVIYFLAEGIGWIFVPIYFLQNGFSLPQVLMMVAAMMAFRILFRLFYIWFYKYLQYKWGMVFGMAMMAAAVALLPYVLESNYVLAAFLMLFSGGATFYWVGFHCLFSFVGESADRGKNVAMIYSMLVLAEAFVPLASGLIAAVFGFDYLFIAAGIIMIVSLIPLISVVVPPEPLTATLQESLKDPHCRWGGGYHLAFGFLDMANVFLWRIAAFILIGDLVLYGGTLSAGMLALALIHLIIGVYVDRGKGRSLFMIGSGLALIQVIFRGLFATTPVSIAASESFTMGDKLMTLKDRLYYNFGEKSCHRFWYHFWGEVAWDIATIVLMSLTSGLLLLGLSLPLAIMLLAPLGLLGAMWMVLVRAPKIERDSG